MKKKTVQNTERKSVKKGGAIGPSSRTSARKNFFRENTGEKLNELIKGQCAGNTLGADLLVEYMETLNPSVAEQIEQTELDSDQLRDSLIYYVENSFITPVSRHYLFQVSRVMDDVIDAIKDIKDFIQYFDYHPTEKNLAMAKLNREAIHIEETSVTAWIEERDDDFWKGMDEITEIEHRVKRLFWENLKEIEEEDSLQGVITSREFARDLRDLARKTRKVADRLSDLKIKSIK